MDLAETLTQECFLKAHRNWDRFRGESSAMTWLMRIAINLQKDHWRNRRLQFWRQARTNSVDLDEASEWLPSGERSAEQKMLAREQVGQVWKAVEGSEQAAADGFSAQVCGRPGFERNCAGNRLERGNGEGAPFAGARESARGTEGEVMSLDKEQTNGSGDLEARLEEALKNFRSSVRAWSEAEYSRPRSAPHVVRLTSWRVAAGWALGCVLAAGTVTGGIYVHHQQQVAKQAGRGGGRPAAKGDGKAKVRRQ